MADLLELRDKIDEIDRQIIQLFEERMDVSRQVADFKIRTGK
ncbi:MAG: bifunctional chorismate mutase/prephenate dehydratase, partial [Lachnospiraceae bacterium]|nr:bifunctional chorismate mutase/prephenate dehydratase [Lachnospiraceae bacterium]